MVSPLAVSFGAGDAGRWRIERIEPYRGEGLPYAQRLDVREGPQDSAPDGCIWTLSGLTGELRYTTASERHALAAVQAGLGRSVATCAALIPIRKRAMVGPRPGQAARDL
jgi:hypothetical protein